MSYTPFQSPKVLKPPKSRIKKPFFHQDFTQEFACENPEVLPKSCSVQARKQAPCLSFTSSASSFARLIGFEHAANVLETFTPFIRFENTPNVTETFTLTIQREFDE